MRKLRLYLDTSIISNIDAPHAPVLETITKEFFHFVVERPDEYELVISPVGIAEIDRSPKEKRSQFFAFLKRLNHTELAKSQEALELADIYVREGVLSEKHIRDLTHIAYAVVSRCDFIVSWNMKHFLRAKVIIGVNVVNLANNYLSPNIVTPLVILGDENDENQPK